MIDISDIKVGDRVRISRDNGDEATFTVTSLESKALHSDTNYYITPDWDHIEKLAPPLPTKTGVYLPYKPQAGFIGSVWLLTGGGVWLNLPNHAGATVTKLPLDALERAHERGSIIYLGTGQEQ